MTFVDFAAVKEAVSFEDAIQYLHLNLKQSGSQWRGPCPHCKSGGERALVITDQKGWYCWSLKKGGDVIALAAHVLDCQVKEAAQKLAEHAGIVPVPERKGTGTSTSRGTVPQERGGEGKSLSPLSYLDAENEAVVALGLDPEWCKLHGIGYAPKGVVRGSVAIPFRDEDGTLLGYFGVQDLSYIPPDFTTNVVSLDKRRA